MSNRYNPLLWFFFIGAVAPIPFYYLARRSPLSFWRYINIPVFFVGVNAMPPATGINYASWLLTGFFFQWYMRRYHFRWWMRYNYILSAALDASVALALIVIFFTLQYPKNGTIGLNTIQSWWGNTGALFSVCECALADVISCAVYLKTADALGKPFHVLKPGETFGPSSWS
jgi:hypothetical protein